MRIKETILSVAVAAVLCFTAYSLNVVKLFIAIEADAYNNPAASAEKVVLRDKLSAITGIPTDKSNWQYAVMVDDVGTTQYVWCIVVKVDGMVRTRQNYTKAEMASWATANIPFLKNHITLFRTTEDGSSPLINNGWGPVDE